MHTYIQADTGRQDTIQTYRQTEQCMHTDKHTGRQTNKHTYRQPYIHTDRKAYRQENQIEMRRGNKQGYIYIYKHKYMQTYIQVDRHQADKHTYTNTYIDSNRQADRRTHINRNTYHQTDRGGHTGNQEGRQGVQATNTYRQADRQAGKQTGRQAGRQTDRQTGKQRARQDRAEQGRTGEYTDR